MEEYFPLLRRTQLFSGLTDAELAEMLGCLQGRQEVFHKGEYVYQQGERIGSITILLEGCLHIQSDDYWGNRSIISTLRAGEMFGAAYAVPEGEPLRNDVVAVEDSIVLFLEVRRLFTVCPSGCKFHALVVQNLFLALSAKNRSLMQKLDHITKRSTREKLISYLSEEARRCGSASFSIPFDRQQLADYLSVDRSAMSKELCRMRDDGLLSFEKNHFVLHHTR